MTYIAAASILLAIIGHAAGEKEAKGALLLIAVLLLVGLVVA